MAPDRTMVGAPLFLGQGLLAWRVTSCCVLTAGGGRLLHMTAHCSTQSRALSVHGEKGFRLGVMVWSSAQAGRLGLRRVNGDL